MELNWLIMAGLVVVAAVLAALMLRVQGANGFIRSELETARKELDQARESLTAKEKELESARSEVSRLKHLADGSRLGASQNAASADSAATKDEPPEQARTIVRRPEPAATDEPEESLRTMLYQPPSDDESGDSTTGAPYLQLGDGGEVHFLDFGTTNVGREQGCDITIEDAAASRSHFEIMYTGNRFQLLDKNSTNGTLHNGEKVEQVWLEFGDTIRVGETEMTFSSEGFDLKDSDPSKAVELLEKCVGRQPEFVSALRVLAFLLERDVGRKGEAAPLWEAVARLEN